MLIYIAQLVYFMLPAYFANMTPVFSKKINILNKPIWKQGLGANKTWRGMILGIITATIVAVIQSKIIIGLELYSYSQPVLFGALMGLGALFGDCVKSYFKRKKGIKSGGKWFPFDQTDYAIGAIIFTSPIYFVGWTESLIILILAVILHTIANHIGYWLKLKEAPW